MNRPVCGQTRPVDPSTTPVPGPGDDPAAPTVTLDLADDPAGVVAEVTVRGELTEAARRPLVRELTDLLLGTPALRGIRLLLREVTFMNSAGTAVLVQLQKMAQPRGLDVVLVEPPSSVTRPLQMTGLWHRFPVEESAGEGVGEEQAGGA